MAVGFGERVNAINNARQDVERVEGMSFDAESCAEVEESVGTLEVSCFYESYSGFFA